MASYELDGKSAIVTGGGAGINLAITKLLLARGCSVMIADLRLGPEADQLLQAYQAKASKPSVLFHPTDVTSWTQLSALWAAALGAFGTVHVVVNGAGVIDTGSSFWHAPGRSPLARDAADQEKGLYRIFGVNTIGPIRLAQIALDHWLEEKRRRDDDDDDARQEGEGGGGNILWVASVAGYTHMFSNPLYSASKAAIVSMVKSLGPLKETTGIRNAAICPGLVRTAIMAQNNMQLFLTDDDPSLSPEDLATVAIRVLTDPQYGDGNIVEARMAKLHVDDGGKETILTREVPVEALYPQPEGGDAATNTWKRFVEDTQRVAAVLNEKGMRSGDDTL